MTAIEYNDVQYAYTGGKTAVCGITLRVEKGAFVAVIGHNGSGKSTLAKLTNALFLPSGGSVMVLGIDTRDAGRTFELRSHAGMVFQNPDNQMVTSIIEEDVAFGPENLGVAPHEIRFRVDEALKSVDMKNFALDSPEKLSGGQKQRVAIAGILAMRPDIIILDEPTAMLDPRGRQEVLATVRQLNKSGITVVLITHFMEEAAQADVIAVIEDGKLAMTGNPAEVFKSTARLREMGLDVPFAVRLRDALLEAGLPVSPDVFTEEGLAEELCLSLSKT